MTTIPMTKIPLIHRRTSRQVEGMHWLARNGRDSHSTASGRPGAVQCREDGVEVLTDRSRRPVRHANPLPDQVERVIISCKRDTTVAACSRICMHHDRGCIDLEQRTLQTIDHPFGRYTGTPGM